MKFMQRAFGLVRPIAVVLALALPVVAAVSAADARVGGGFNSGSRGARTFSAPRRVHGASYCKLLDTKPNPGWSIYLMPPDATPASRKTQPNY